MPSDKASPCELHLAFRGMQIVVTLGFVPFMPRMGNAASPESYPARRNSNEVAPVPGSRQAAYEEAERSFVATRV